MTLKKDPSILELIDRLQLEEKGWTVKDHWEIDLCAIGIGSRSRPDRLIYVSTFNLPPGHYNFECEVANDEGDLPYSVADAGENVEIAALSQKMIDFLGADNAPADTSQRMRISSRV